MKNVIVSVFKNTYTMFPLENYIKSNIRKQNNYFLQHGNINITKEYKEDIQQWFVQVIISMKWYKFLYCLLVYYPVLFVELSQSQGIKESSKYIKQNLKKIYELNKKYKEQNGIHLK